MLKQSPPIFLLIAERLVEKHLKLEDLNDNRFR